MDLPGPRLDGHRFVFKDTNILLRAARRSDPQHELVYSALAKLAVSGTTLYYTHQNIAELWNAMTRPLARNGLGLTVGETEREYARSKQA
jgi:predicted nucleic acid-binding protein